MYALDSNPGPQNGRHRRNHRAKAAAHCNICLLLTDGSVSYDKKTDRGLAHLFAAHRRKLRLELRAEQDPDGQIKTSELY